MEEIYKEINRKEKFYRECMDILDTILDENLDVLKRLKGV